VSVGGDRLLFAVRHAREFPDAAPDLSPGACHLLAVLALHAGRKGVFPSVAKLAGIMHVTERTVQRHRAELVEAAGILVETGGGRTRANRYRFPGEPVLEAARNPDTSVRVSDSERVTPVTERVTPVSLNPDTSVTRSIYEGSIEERGRATTFTDEPARLAALAVGVAKREAATRAQRVEDGIIQL
jgi:hypothetical protein